MYSSGAASFYSEEVAGSLVLTDNRVGGTESVSYVYRTPSSTTNRRTFTFSGWYKRAKIGTSSSYRSDLFAQGDTANPGTPGMHFWIQADDSNQIQWEGEGGTVESKVNGPNYRDPTAWYHFVIAIDTTQGTPANRVKIYVNGEQQTVGGQPSQNHDYQVNVSGQPLYIGANNDGGSVQAHNGYRVANVHFIDGQQLAASSFGETKSGVWIPKAYSGSYGTNGFHLKFDGNLNDSSGNGNNFTGNNVGSWDYQPDSPTNNFCTVNPLNCTSSAKPQEGNLEFVNGANDQAGAGTFGVTSGKWYWEVNYPTNDCPEVGVMPLNQYLSNRSTVGTGTVDGLARITNGSTMRDPSWASVTNTGLSSQTSAGTIRVVLDADNGKLWVSDLGGTYPNSGDPETGANPQGTFDSDWVDQTGGVTPFVLVATGTSQFCILNFGQDSTFNDQTASGGNSDENGYGDFKYSVPSGYLALCTANLTVAEAVDPLEDNSPQDYFNTVLYTGNGSTQSITGVGFQPDFVWGKERSSTSTPTIYDAIRGATKMLNPSGTDAESTVSNQLTSFDSDGFSLGNSGGINENSQTYVAWNWKANGSGSANSEGSVTTTSTSANTNAGFSIITWTGDGTLGHGLDQAPEMFIVKIRNTAGSWWVWHKDLSNTSAGFLQLNSANGEGSNTSVWRNSYPATATTIDVNTSYLNYSTDNYLAYCFHSVEGFSKFGSYTGNGSSDGPFVYTGMRPAYVLIKRTNGANAWIIFDAVRNTYNLIDKELYANTNESEDTVGRIDFTSNGFKIRQTGLVLNASGGNYVYMAFAENPFKYANAR